MQVLEGKDVWIVQREDLASFGNIIGDHNPVHRDVDSARKVGFLDIPVFAIMTAAKMEQMYFENNERI